MVLVLVSSGKFQETRTLVFILTIGAPLLVLSRPSQYVLFYVGVPSRRTTPAGTRHCPRVVSTLSHVTMFIYTAVKAGRYFPQEGSFERELVPGRNNKARLVKSASQ